MDVLDQVQPKKLNKRKSSGGSRKSARKMRKVEKQEINDKVEKIEKVGKVKKSMEPIIIERTLENIDNIEDY